MLKIFYLLFAVALMMGCKQAKNERGKDTMSTENIVQASTKPVALAKEELQADPLAFIPKGYVFFSRCVGDLNHDGEPDMVMMIKGTDKSKWVNDEQRGRLDRNRRGLIILFKHDDGYKLIAENDECFSSENEDGGVYYAPELSLDINKNCLLIKYAHGRFGNWQYTFGYHNNDFELIGYYHNRCIRYATYYNLDINFHTCIRVYEENLKVYDKDGNEEFKVTKTKIKRRKPINLSEVVDFDKLNKDEFADE